MGVLSWVELGWAVVIGGISLAGSCTLFAPQLSVFLNDLVKYGKSHSKERSWIHRLIEVPKRWFVHFYIIALISTSVAIFAAVNNYALLPENDIGKWIRTLNRSSRNVRAPEGAVLLALILFWAHAFRRLWETLFLCVYSETKMNLIHYLVGVGFYTLVPLCLLSDARGAIRLPSVGSLSLYQWFGFPMFVWSSYSQHSCFHILANMRKNFLGNITTYAHGIPVGGWFEYCSCPHFFFEILIYAALYLFLEFSHRLWGFVFLFVLSNQIIAALITHRWYQERFRDYPKERTAIVPCAL